MKVKIEEWENPRRTVLQVVWSRENHTAGAVMSLKLQPGVTKTRDFPRLLKEFAEQCQACMSQEIVPSEEDCLR